MPGPAWPNRRALREDQGVVLMQPGHPQKLALREKNDAYRHGPEYRIAE